MSKIIEVYSKGERYEVIVDDDVIPPGKVFKMNNYYCFKYKRKNVRLHRWIMGVKDRSMTVDHIDNNPENNTRENLRVCTQQENEQNKRHKGYCFHKGNGKWLARVKINGKHKHLGYFENKEEAQQVYRKAHAEAFGEFSPYYNYDSGNTKEVN